jgi:hypothetical protein
VGTIKKEKMRLITRADFDGLACAVLLKKLKKYRRIYLTHAAVILKKELKISGEDIVANLPYDPRCGMWFDHHETSVADAEKRPFRGAFALADSCAQVIYDYYAPSPQLEDYKELVDIANIIDAAKFTPEQIRQPEGWFVIAETLQPFYHHNNLMALPAYFRLLVDLIIQQPLPQILSHPEVVKRSEIVRSERARFGEIVNRHSRVFENVVVTDYRDLERPIFGSRFWIYDKFPEQQYAINIFKPRGRDVVVLSCGRNIFGNEKTIHIGEVMAQFGGGGHNGAGSCEVTPEASEEILSKIVKQLNSFTGSP